MNLWQDLPLLSKQNSHNPRVPKMTIHIADKINVIFMEASSSVKRVTGKQASFHDAPIEETCLKILEY